MNIKDEAKKRLKEMRLWKESEEYKSLCSERCTDCERLVGVGEEYLQFIRDNGAEVLRNVAYVEYASNGDIHRGVYCPSPVLDLIIGNVHRGRILKRITVRSKISHRFGFDEQKKLIYTETLDSGEVLNTEFLFARGNCRLGITINSKGDLESISEEEFENQKIVRYCYLNAYPEDNKHFCANLHIETYLYNANGLVSCKREEYQPYINDLRICLYDFSWEKGYLSTFTVKEYPVRETDAGDYAFPVYTVILKRKI